MVEVLSGTPDEEDEGDELDEEGENTDNNEEEAMQSDNNAGPRDANAMRPATWDIDEERLHLDSARIYEKTIVQLGNRLGDALAERTMTAD
jgi:hypothetical protein